MDNAPKKAPPRGHKPSTASDKAVFVFEDEPNVKLQITTDRQKVVSIIDGIQRTLCSVGSLRACKQPLAVKCRENSPDKYFALVNAIESYA